jgi:NAD(P)-dependent dehydrogenase (short-subunit alcohol dehydrogenase family)
VEVSGSVALVTGAAAGTGRAIAEALASRGAAVVVADTDAREGGKTVERIASRGGRARFIEVDVTSGDDVRAMVAFAERELGGLQVLVNNAGGGGDIERTSPTPVRPSGGRPSSSTWAPRCRSPGRPPRSPRRYSASPATTASPDE